MLNGFAFNAAIPPGEEYPRYFKYSLGLIGSKLGNSHRTYATWPTIDTESLPTPPVIFAHHVEINDTTGILGLFSCCIYCGSRTHFKGAGLPADEHIIPQGIGGTLIVEKASCQDCADKISAFESWVQFHQFSSTRRGLEIRGKRNLSDNDVTVRVPVFNSSLDDHKNQLVPYKEVPAVLFLPVMNTPGILCTRPPWQHGIHRLWIHKMAIDDAFSEGKLKDFFLPELDVIRFSQFLCKIAYSYSSTYLGMPEYIYNRQSPSAGKRNDMLEFFLRKPKNKETTISHYQFFGGFADNFAPSTYLHEIGRRSVILNDNLYHIVDIRLFANLGAPIYSVVVGWDKIF